MPIIRRKMLHRADRGELLPSLAGEAKWLAQWIRDKVTSHQVPTPGAIENALRTDYAALKARSKGMKP